MKLAQNWKPVLLLLVVFIARETGGQSIVFSYTVYLFNESGVTLDAFTCTLLVGVVRLICTIIGAFLMDFGGRRPLLITSLVICALALLTAGGVMIAEVEGPARHWVPLIAVLIFAAGYSAGVNPVPWALQGELIPTPVRALGSSMTTMFYSLTVFGVTNIFPELLNAIGLGYSFLIFSACMAITIFIIWYFVPETSGRSLLELETAFAKNYDKYDIQNTPHQSINNLESCVLPTTKINPKNLILTFNDEMSCPKNKKNNIFKV